MLNELSVLAVLSGHMNDEEITQWIAFSHLSTSKNIQEWYWSYYFSSWFLLISKPIWIAEQILLKLEGNEERGWYGLFGFLWWEVAGGSVFPKTGWESACSCKLIMGPCAPAHYILCTVHLRDCRTLVRYFSIVLWGTHKWDNFL